MTYIQVLIFILLLALIIVFGIAIVVFNVSNLIQRKPIYISGRSSWRIIGVSLFLVWFLFFISQGINLLKIGDSANHPGIVLLVILLAVMLSVVVYFLQWKSFSAWRSSYQIIGLDKRVLELVRTSLTLKNIPYREQHEDFELLGTDFVITTSIWSGLGSANLRIDPKAGFSILEEVIETMKKYGGEHEEYFYPFAMIFASFIGFLQIGIGLYAICYLVNLLNSHPL